MMLLSNAYLIQSGLVIIQQINCSLWIRIIITFWRSRTLTKRLFWVEWYSWTLLLNLSMEERMRDTVWPARTVPIFYGLCPGVAHSLSWSVVLAAWVECVVCSCHYISFLHFVTSRTPGQCAQLSGGCDPGTKGLFRRARSLMIMVVALCLTQRATITSNVTPQMFARLM